MTMTTTKYNNYYIFIGTVTMNITFYYYSQGENGSLALTISYKGGSFLRAEFPDSKGLKHNHYFILHVDQGQVREVVCVCMYVCTIYIP